MPLKDVTSYAEVWIEIDRTGKYVYFDCSHLLRGGVD